MAPRAPGGGDDDDDVPPAPDVEPGGDAAAAAALDSALRLIPPPLAAAARAAASCATANPAFPPADDLQDLDLALAAPVDFDDVLFADADIQYLQLDTGPPALVPVPPRVHVDAEHTLLPDPLPAPPASPPLPAFPPSEPPQPDPAPDEPPPTATTAKTASSPRPPSAAPGPVTASAAPSLLQRVPSTSAHSKRMRPRPAAAHAHSHATKQSPILIAPRTAPPDPPAVKLSAAQRSSAKVSPVRNLKRKPSVPRPRTAPATHQLQQQATTVKSVATHGSPASTVSRDGRQPLAADCPAPMPMNLSRQYPVVANPHGMMPLMNMGASMYPLQHHQPILSAPGPSGGAAATASAAAGEALRPADRADVPADGRIAAGAGTEAPGSSDFKKMRVGDALFTSGHAPAMSGPPGQQQFVPPGMPLVSPPGMLRFDQNMMPLWMTPQMYLAAVAAAGYPQGVMGPVPIPNPNVPSNMFPQFIGIPNPAASAPAADSQKVSSGGAVPAEPQGSNPPPSVTVGTASAPTDTVQASAFLAEDGRRAGELPQQSLARLEHHPPMFGRLHLQTLAKGKAAAASAGKPGGMKMTDTQGVPLESPPKKPRFPGTRHPGPNSKGGPASQAGSSSHAEGEQSRPQKKRLVWTPELHERFVKAIDVIGLNQAVPKALLTIMNVEGLTTEHVKSHLQKYRNSLRKEAAEDARTNGPRAAEAANLSRSGASASAAAGADKGGSSFGLAADANGARQYRILPNRISLSGAPVSSTGVVSGAGPESAAAAVNSRSVPAAAGSARVSGTSAVPAVDTLNWASSRSFRMRGNRDGEPACERLDTADDDQIRNAISGNAADSFGGEDQIQNEPLGNAANSSGDVVNAANLASASNDASGRRSGKEGSLGDLDKEGATSRTEPAAKPLSPSPVGKAVLGIHVTEAAEGAMIDEGASMRRAEGSSENIAGVSGRPELMEDLRAENGDRDRSRFEKQEGNLNAAVGDVPIEVAEKKRGDSPAVSGADSTEKAARGSREKEAKLEAIKEKTLHMQLQLQMMVHRTIALEKKIQQESSEQMRAEAESSGTGAARGSTHSLTGNLEKTSVDAKAAAQDVNGGSKGKMDMNTGDVGGRRTGKDSGHKSELAALLQDQERLGKLLEAQQAMLKERMAEDEDDARGDDSRAGTAGGVEEAGAEGGAEARTDPGG